VAETTYPADHDTHLRFSNVVCVIYPASASADEQVARLRTSADALAAIDG
jgi:hypothetical protein